ncbi:hypothetical protein AAC387_Pa02g4645 [Persea americana]
MYKCNWGTFVYEQRERNRALAALLLLVPFAREIRIQRRIALGFGSISVKKEGRERNSTIELEQEEFLSETAN